MQPNVLIWLVPAVVALVLYGLGQGLVKKYIADVPPARFCLFFVVAKALVNFGYFATQEHPPLTASTSFMLVGTLAYVFDGLGWILYFKSIVMGPITIVGTLSAAYPALTVLFARVFLKETVQPMQYVAIALVIAGCLGVVLCARGRECQSDKEAVDTAGGISFGAVGRRANNCEVVVRTASGA